MQKASGALRVREATLEDVPGITRVHVEAWRTTYAGLVPRAFLDALSFEERASMWRKAFEHEDLSRRRFVLAVEQGDAVVGFAAAGPSRESDSPFDAELYAIYILANHQRVGAGRELMRALAPRLSGAGFEALFLWVLRDNPSRAFYERLGGALVGSKKIVIGGAELDEVAYGWRDIHTLSTERS